MTDDHDTPLEARLRADLARLTDRVAVKERPEPHLPPATRLASIDRTPRRRPLLLAAAAVLLVAATAAVLRRDDAVSVSATATTTPLGERTQPSASTMARTVTINELGGTSWTVTAARHQTANAPQDWVQVPTGGDAEPLTIDFLNGSVFSTGPCGPFVQSGLAGSDNDEDCAPPDPASAIDAARRIVRLAFVQPPRLQQQGDTLTITATLAEHTFEVRATAAGSAANRTVRWTDLVGTRWEVHELSTISSKGGPLPAALAWIQFEADPAALRPGDTLPPVVVRDVTPDCSTTAGTGTGAAGDVAGTAAPCRDGGSALVFQEVATILQATDTVTIGQGRLTADSPAGRFGAGPLPAADPTTTNAMTTTPTRPSPERIAADIDRAEREICSAIDLAVVADVFATTAQLEIAAMSEDNGPACGVPHPERGGYLVVVQFLTSDRWLELTVGAQPLAGLAYDAVTAPTGPTVYVRDEARNVITAFHGPDDTAEAGAALVRYAQTWYPPTTATVPTGLDTLPLGAAGCTPASPRVGAEIRGTTPQGHQLYGLLFTNGPVRAGDDVKIVWRMTGSGALQATATGPDGQLAPPVGGPTPHAGSTYDRLGDEWDTTYRFDQPGCWHLQLTRDDTRSDIWIDVQPR